MVGPSTPTVAVRLGEQLDDPVTMYVDDVVTTPANLAGIPAISIPGGTAEHGMPMGIHIQGPAHADDVVYRVAGGIERLIEDATGVPFYDRAPEVPAAVTLEGDRA
jgi:aspartyl-tRNA(Asn)/glutamyl-tRNA(Gln) amidotransferase subunit A